MEKKRNVNQFYIKLEQDEQDRVGRNSGEDEFRREDSDSNITKSVTR